MRRGGFRPPTVWLRSCYDLNRCDTGTIRCNAVQ